ncbi:hypothetical protein LMG10661_00627 [Ralstonia syzygii subsp. syzygii]|nr:hypothetical protein LMG10661_00627 [Ralstonia syzygii subsp. syzygii]
MKRIATTNAVVDLFGPGKNGFGAGNPAAGVRPTYFSADWCNDVQEEICALPEVLGLVIDGSSRNMLATAVQKLCQTNATNVGIDTGAANAYVVAFSPALTAPVPWAPFWINVKTTNTGASTLNATGVAYALVGGAHAALQGGEMVGGGCALIYWNPTLNNGNGQYVLAFCTGAAEQVGTATASQHAVQLGQMQATTGSAGSTSYRNKLINSGAQVVIQSTSPSLSTSPQYGPVEMIAGWASGGAITAGTLVQDTAAPVGRSGKAVRFQGCTLTGAGQLSWRYRMESADAVNLKNQTATFQIKVQHNAGVAINYTTIIRKPTAADNYTATSVIGTSAATAVASGAAQPLKFTQALGDCSYGLEIEVQATCGAVTAKDFWWTEWGLEEGATAATIEFRPIAVEQMACQRYYQADAFHCGGAPIASGSGSTAIISNSSSLQGTKTLPVQMRVAPTMTFKDTAGNAGGYTVYNGATNQNQGMSSGGIGTSATTIDMDATWGAYGATWCRVTYVLNARL